jgi:hypothetical protein
MLGHVPSRCALLSFHNHHIISLYLRRLGGLLSLVSTELGLGCRLGLLLGLTDGGSPGDGGLAKVGSVAVLGGLVGDSNEGPI